MFLRCTFNQLNMLAARLSIVASNGCIRWHSCLNGAIIRLGIDIICEHSWVDDNVVFSLVWSARCAFKPDAHFSFTIFQTKDRTTLKHNILTLLTVSFSVYLCPKRIGTHLPFGTVQTSAIIVQILIIQICMCTCTSHRHVSHRLAWHCYWKWSAHIAAVCFYGRNAKLPYEYRFEDYSNWIHGNFGISEERESFTTSN